MADDKTFLRRLMLFEAWLAVGGILAASGMYLFALGHQQKLASDLFQHPFAVANAAMEFQSQLLEFRNDVLEAAVARRTPGEDQVARLQRLTGGMDASLAIVRAEFLGDRDPVDDIYREMDAWRPIREQAVAQLVAGNPNGSLLATTQRAAPHIARILTDLDYVISFARARAARFVEDGATTLERDRLIAIVSGVCVLLAYAMLSFQLRRKVFQIYDRELHNATFDELSGAYNRRSLIRHAEAEIKRAQRHGHALALLMMDLDNFKRVNDTYGHETGDSVLRQFGAICSHHLRETDALGRVGGEEFALVLPHADRQGAVEAAERIRQEFAACEFRSLGDGRSKVKVTVSIGIATLGQQTPSVDSLMKHADAALYRSKNTGRDRVTVSEDEPLAAEHS